MTVERRWLPQRSLATATAAAAATLGLLMGVGALALAFAVVSTRQPANQAVTAATLLIVSVVNLLASRGIRHERRGALLRSGVATLALMVYLGAGLRDFGEAFWLHGSYLLLLLVFSWRAHQRLSVAHPVASPRA